jgi:Origin recognition complex subunit 2
VHAVPDEGQVAAIRLVASIDHVDASAALWSSSTAFKFGWFWKEIHTYRPYIRELAMLADEDLSAKKAARKQNRATDQAARVLEVLKNLAPRYGEVMQVLAKLQLKELKSSSASPWVDYKVFRSECKSGFLIDKESKLRTLQTELTDHRLMISKTEGRSEFVSIPYLACQSVPCATLVLNARIVSTVFLIGVCLSYCTYYFLVAQRIRMVEATPGRFSTILYALGRPL